MVGHRDDDEWKVWTSRSGSALELTTLIKPKHPNTCYTPTSMTVNEMRFIKFVPRAGSLFSAPIEDSFFWLAAVDV